MRWQWQHRSTGKPYTKARASNQLIFILKNYNVTSIAMTGILIYYLAEDSAGTPIIGVYNLETGDNEVLSESQRFTTVQTIG
jgi:hypothetical protein